MKKLFLAILFLPLFSKAQIINTFAGSVVTSFSGDGGPADSAFLDMPVGVAVDAAGNKYIADEGNNRIRMVNAAGVITTIAGNGGAYYAGDGGPATAASLDAPAGVAVDAAGNIYIADAGNNRIRVINTSGIISTIAGNGSGGFAGDGSPATAAMLSGPSALAVDASGNVYIADQGNHVVREISGGIINTIAGTGTIAGFDGDGGPATDALFNHPAGIALDATGNIYVADEFNARIRMINTGGVINTIAGNGSFGYAGDGGAAVAAELYQPTGIILDASGNIYIADMVNDAVRKINTSGIINTIGGIGSSGFGGDGGPATSALMHFPCALALDAGGNLFIADQTNNRVREINTSGTMSTLVGNGLVGYGDGGPATAAQLGGPQDVAIDAIGNVYIADIYHNLIRKVDTAGIISTFAGTGMSGYTGDGGPATAAAFNQPIGLAVDDTGNIYIADVGNVRIRKVNPAGIITTVVGSGALGYSGDGGPALDAALNAPQYVAVDHAGNMYISDQNTLIRKINAAGIITTLAGGTLMGFAGDGGPAAMALFSDPMGVGTDVYGNVYIADGGNNRIRMIDTAGNINTIAGNGTTGATGDGGAATAAELNYPSGVSVDNAGNIIISDYLNNRTRIINSDGTISTVAGNGIYAYTGDGGLAMAASLAGPSSSRSDNHGRIFIADFENNAIRVVTGLPASLSPITGGPAVCLGTVTDLTDFTSGGTWSSSNTSVATIGSSSGVVTGLVAGTVNITYTFDTSSVVTTLTIDSCAATGVATLSNNLSLSVYPNPAHDELTVQTTGQFINEINITNLLGQTVYLQTAHANCKLQTVDVSGLADGVYFVQVNNSVVRKFVKE